MKSKLLYLVIFLAVGFACFAQNNAKETKDTAIVYFCSNITPENVLKMYEALGVKLPGQIGLKVHFGERGNQNYLDPNLLRPLVDKVRPTFVETNVLYVSDRRFTNSHIALAKEHGFTFAPIDILDAEDELVYSTAGMNFKYCKTVKTGTHFDNYDSFIIYSHFKGHGSAGFGGAIKNVAMGMASPGGKMAMHANTFPVTCNTNQCTQCQRCVQQCPAMAISVDDKGPVIDTTKCIGCAKCLAECPKRLFMTNNDNFSEEAFLDKLVEYAKVLSEQRPMLYINVLANISELCDCSSKAPAPFMGDIGIVSSTDIVAIDRASHDLVAAMQGKKEAFRHKNKVKAKHQLDYAEQLGMGTQTYILIDIATGQQITLKQAIKQTK